MARKKPIIGLCGGIGAGKSRVAAEFEQLGCLVLDSDRLNHEVLRRPEVLAELREWWGPQVVTAEGTPDREQIAALIFADDGKRRRLQGLVYPLIAELRATKILAANRDPAVKAIILDSPLLFESNLDRECDTVVFVDAGLACRLLRLAEGRGWSEEKLQERERWHLLLADKRERSEYVIDNEGPPGRLRPQVTDILDKIVLKHASDD
ncbi:MAG: dephospho-CoA kinase [Phycisphaerae bacterium]|jgi:dephospho-CoA kinase